MLRSRENTILENSGDDITRTRSGDAYQKAGDDRNDRVTITQVEEFEPERQPVSQPAGDKKATGTRYLAGDWGASRRRVPLDGAGKTVAQKLAVGVTVGGSIGSAIPVIGTTVGSVVGAAVQGLRSLFNRDKDDRLIEHVEKFYVELIRESFGNDAFSIGLNMNDGNGKNAARLLNQFPQHDMESFLIQAGKEFFRSVEGIGGLDSGDVEALRAFSASLHFQDSLPAYGSEAALLSFKVDPEYYQVTESGVQKTSQNNEVSKSASDNKKVFSGMAAAASLLFLLR